MVKTVREWLGRIVAVAAGTMVMPGLALADAKPTLDTGNTAWMITATALVLLMTLPGLGLFYGGMVRKKNVLSVVMQMISITSLVSVLWVVAGYSLAFSSGSGYIGGLSKAFFAGVGYDTLSGSIPETVFATFQMTFAIITPALIVGAFAERMKFSAMFVFMGIWVLAVYSPIAHWVWGGGWLGGMGTMDFAGGTVVHINAGVAGLVAALVLGKRVGYPKEAMLPHNLVLTLIGTGLLWVGWFGFNAGSALAAGSLATSALVATHFGAAAAAIGWALAEWMRNGKPSVLGGISGAVAGLVAITPASGFVGPMSALAIGFIAGVFCYLMVTKVKGWFGYDDSLDAFGVHGAGGTIGALLTGVFATRAVNPIFKDSAGNPLPVGLLDGNGHQILNQLLAVAIAWALAAVGTLLILKVVDATIGVRVPEEHEIQGLDLSQHGGEGYNREV